METATFAAGCFWGVEAAFQQIPGVVSTRVGYTGGNTRDPTYEDVCSDRTGHAEAVEVTFDPRKVGYRELLSRFFSLHDPTQVNRQGPDTGTQYRSAVFYHSEEQKTDAAAMIRDLTDSGRYRDPIVTQVIPAGTFWLAEEYHQSYYLKMGRRYGGL